MATLPGLIHLFKIVRSLSYFPSGICGADFESYKISSISHMSVFMHIEINIITSLYLVPFVTGIYLPHLYLYFVYLCHPLK